MMMMTMMMMMMMICQINFIFSHVLTGVFFNDIE